ncbi:MAG: helix-hairpin-helix domain-containing protein [Candidatus Staskawiczbacteria bacterium]|nr:helix-hairpin-helix domain-containing protein [Candidatus Staskawiczbacteria bacterium]
MFAKKPIFYFLISFSITFIVGFFVWSVFVDFPGNLVKPVLAEINSKFFTASILPDLSINLTEEKPTEQNLEPAIDLATDIANQNLVVLSGEDEQDQLDNIQEKLDIIKQKVQALVEEQNQNDQTGKLDEDKKIEDKKEEDLKEPEKIEETFVCTGQININTASAEDLDKITQIGPVTAEKIIAARPFYSLNDLLKVSGIGEITLQKIIEQNCAFVEFVSPPPAGGGDGGGGGDSAPIAYPKILISEVQVAGVSDDKQEFVELYNPNFSDIDLTGWYLQRKTASGSSWSTYVPANLFADKTISANEYFLIARTGYYLDSADVFTDNPITNDNSFVLKNPNGEISDKLGFGSALDFELLSTTSPSSGQSIGRKVLSDNTEQDTDDNSADFELQNPTPKSQNVTYVEPIPVPIPPPEESEEDKTPPSIITYTISNTTITPDNSATIIGLAFSEKVNYEIDILDSDGNMVKGWSGTATNPDKKTWDGNNESDFVPNGIYTIKISATDIAGNKMSDDTSQTIAVDNSA